MDKYTFKVKIEMENIPTLIRAIYGETIANDYVEGRDKACSIFNKRIKEINDEWSIIGVSTTVDDTAESLDPEYISFIRKKLAKDFYNLNKDRKLVKLRISENGDISGYIPFINGSNIYAVIVTE